MGKDDNIIKGKFGPQGERVYKGKASEVFAQIKAEREAYERAHGITNEEKKTGITKKKPTNIDKITKVEFKKELMNKVKPGDSLKTVKLAGKALARLIPYAGWALAAKEVYDIGTALYKKHSGDKRRKSSKTLSSPVTKTASSMRKVVGQEKRGGGSVKSKYSTSNKRYSNGGKIYPR